MKRVIVAAAAMMAALAAPAFAQFSGSQDAQKTPLQLQYEREARDQRDNEKAYNDQIRRLKAQKPTAKSDPWAGVRSSDETGNTKR
jgi:type II secretory pathway pseudopilin PulG